MLLRPDAIDLAAWQLRLHIKNDAGELWTRAATLLANLWVQRGLPG
jgi:hypothetical protein